MNLFSLQNKSENTAQQAAESSTTRNESGFTLIEALVAFAVIAIVAGMVFTQREGFSRSINLSNVAHEIALTIRQAQSYGVSSRGSSLEDEVDDFAYGLYFTTSNPQEFVLFRDVGGDKGYQSSDEVVETYSLPSEMEISGVCVNGSFNDTNCSSGGELVIMFSRPNPNAEFYNKSGSAYGGQTAVVVVEENTGTQRNIVTRSSGFVIVDQP